MTAVYRLIVTDDVDPTLVEHDSVGHTTVPQDKAHALELARLLLELPQLPDDHGPWRRARPGGQRTVTVERVR